MILNRLIDAWGFNFFINGIIIGILLAFIYSIIGIFVVIRKESNVTHTMSNFALLGIAFGLYFGINLNICASLISIIGSFIIIKFQNTKIFSNDSIMEFMAQISIAGAIVIISQLSGYRSDINNYLFGNILALSKDEFWYFLFISFILIIIFLAYKNIFLQVILSNDLAKSKGVNTKLVNIILLTIIAVSISIGIKLIGVLLLSAFIVIPPNIGKIFAKNYNQMIIYSISAGIIGVFIGINMAFILDAPTGAIIILNLGLMLFFSLLYSKYILKY